MGLVGMSGVTWWAWTWATCASAVAPVDDGVPALAFDAPDRQQLAGDRPPLPDGVGGVLPERDGDAFVLLPPAGKWPGDDAEQVAQALDAMLPGAGLPGVAATLVRAGEAVDVPPVDPAALEAERDAREAELVEPLGQTVGPLTQETADALLADGEAMAARLLAPQREWWFTQLADGVPIEGASVRVVTEDGYVRSIFGALHSDPTVANAAVIDADRAVAAATAYVGEWIAGSARWSRPTVALDGKELRHCWVVGVDTELGTYDVWVDAETSEIGQVNAEFANASGRGRVYRPHSNGLWDTMVVPFDVGQNWTGVGWYYTLSTQAQVMDNRAADGFAGFPSVWEVGYGLGDFDVAPYNDHSNTLDASNPPWLQPYNPWFQHINVKGWVTLVNQWFGLRGANPAPPYTLVFNDAAALDTTSGDRASIRLGAGARTLGYANGQFNPALDATVIAHELAHGLVRRQMGDVGFGVQFGVLHPAVDEGLADYLAIASTGIDDDTVGAAMAGFLPARDDGQFPRRADPGDNFPDRMVDWGCPFPGCAVSPNSGNPHERGQVLAFALLSAREELGRRSALGPFLLDTYLMRAIRGAGIGATTNLSDVASFDAMHAILIGLLAEAGPTLEAQDILVGFAKAGILVSPREAVITIDADILPAFGRPPVFTGWSAQGLGDLLHGGSATRAAWIWLANDPEFTVNVADSRYAGLIELRPIGGHLGSFTWSPSEEQWDKLRLGGPRVYYWVATCDLGTNCLHGEGSPLEADDRSRDSTHYGGPGYWPTTPTVPLAYAVINGFTAPAACASSAGPQGSGAWVAGLALLATLRGRRNRRSSSARACSRTSFPGC